MRIKSAFGIFYEIPRFEYASGIILPTLYFKHESCNTHSVEVIENDKNGEYVLGSAILKNSCYASYICGLKRKLFKDYFNIWKTFTSTRKHLVFKFCLRNYEFIFYGPNLNCCTLPPTAGP